MHGGLVILSHSSAWDIVTEEQEKEDEDYAYEVEVADLII
jgi:hypothetical protein